MGMYTELVISTTVKDNPEAVAVIKYMIGEGKLPENIPDHPLFKTERWPWMLQRSSYYFVPAAMHN